MSCLRNFVSFVVFTLIIFCIPQLVLADESGTYESVSSFVHDYTKFDFADKKIISGPLHGTDTITKSSGGPFVLGESSVFVCAVYVKKSDAGMDLEAPCATTDSSGDVTYVIARRRAGDTETGGGGEGRQEIVGGTGKYAGMTGSCTYTVEYVAGNRGITILSCQWQKP